MVKKCYVLNCKTGRKSCKEKVSLFKAPNDEKMLELWRKTVPQRENILRSVDRICEKHFEKDYVISRWQPSNLGDYVVDHIRPKLTPDAVPTIFSEVDLKDPRIKKYTPEKVNAFDSIVLTVSDAEVSDSDCVPICFNCLIGSCFSHHQLERYD